jgi:hypothetical protein
MKDKVQPPEDESNSLWDLAYNGIEESLMKKYQAVLSKELEENGKHQCGLRIVDSHSLSQIQSRSQKAAHQINPRFIGMMSRIRYLNLLKNERKRS